MTVNPVDQGKYVNKALLVVGLYPAHRTPDVRNSLKSKNVWMAFVPGGGISLAQVHDVWVNRPVKDCLREKYVSHRAAPTDRRLLVRWIAEAVYSPRVVAATRNGMQALVREPMLGERTKCDVGKPASVATKSAVPPPAQRSVSDAERAAGLAEQQSEPGANDGTSCRDRM